MASYKNSIMLGIALESQNDVQGRLKTLIETLNNNKITLDVNIANSNVASQLETLTNLANKFKSSLGSNVSLGDIDKVINNTTSAMISLNDQILKTSKINFNDGTGKQLKEVADGIGVVKKQMETLDKSGNPELGKTAITTVTNNTKIRQSIEDITKAQKQLNALESNGFSDISKITDLRTMLNNPSSIGSDNELKGYLNQVKELLATESKVIDYSNKLTSLKSNMANLTDEKYSNVLNIQSFEQIINEINKAQNGLKNFDGININGLKQQFDQLNSAVSRFNSDTVSSQKAEQDSIKQKEKLENDRIAQLQKEIDLSNKLVENENKRQIKDNSANLKRLQQEQELLQKQAEAYQHIDALKSNGIINESDISNLEQMVKSSKSLQDVRNALNSIMNTSMMKESSIVTMSKQLDDAQIKLDKMKQSFGNKLPNSFVESTQSEINKLKEDLTKVDSMGFNGLKNNLNQINTNMKVTTNETQQLVNSLKETNGGFFNGMSNFLGKVGVFYGVQQVVQEISDQFKNASEYTLMLDKNLTSVSMITGKTKEEVVAITNQFKQLGEQLHITNQEMLAGSEELLRAGFDNNTTSKMLEASSMASKISGQTTQATTEQLIAIKNSFNMTGDQMQHVIDVISKLDNTSATSFKEISSAIMRTAFSAQQAGTSFDTLSSYVTTVSEKTRRSAETIGEAFKTIYSRYSNIKLGNIDEDGKSINDVETAMNRIGLAIRTSKGEFKDFDLLLEEFVNKYKSGNLSKVDFLAGINTLGGTRQKETLLALVENFDTAKKHQEDLTNATGSAKQMYDTYSQSLEAHINDLKRAFEGLYEKIMSSDSLKWLITEATQLVTALSNVDGKTIAFIATIGSLVLVMSKLSELNKTLITGEAVTGLSKFIAVLSGMATVEKTIEETTNATKALQLAQVGLVAETEGLTGLSGAWAMLSNGIKGATTSALAFIATPLGLILTALASVLGIAVAGFVAYKQHQAELVQTSKDLKSAIEGVNNALSNGDTKSASQSLDKVRDEQKALESLIKKRREMEALPEDSFYGKMGGATKAQSIDQITYKINEQIKVIKDAGLSVEETTGKINELQSAEQQIVNQNIVDKIKAETQAQVEHRTNTKANTEEYKKYMSTVQNLYSEYQNLSSQESLSAEQKAQLSTVVEQLQGKIGNLDVQMDANGKTYITNTGLISDTISYYNSEGETVQVLTQIKLQDEKSNSSWQYNNTSMTYTQTTQRIAYYQSEIAEIQKLMQARLTEASMSISSTDASGNDSLNDLQSAQVESHYLKTKQADQSKIDSMNEDIKKLQAGKDAIDKLYTSMTVPTSSAPTLSAPNTNYTPSGGGSSGSGAGSAEKAQEKLLKEATDKEKTYLTDLGSKYTDVKDMISSNVSDIELKETELGDTNNDNYLKKVDLLNEKIAQQTWLLSEAQDNLDAYSNASVTTEDAQTELTKDIKSANSEVISQKKALADLNKEMKSMATDKIKELITEEQKLAETNLENNQKQETTNLESSSYKFSQNEWESYRDSKRQDIQDEISNLQDLQDEGMNETTVIEAISEKQDELNKLDSKSYDTVKNTQKAYTEMMAQRKADLQDEINSIDDKITALEEEKTAQEEANTLLEKQKAITEAQTSLTQKQIDLERLKNQKTVQSYEKQSDGSYQFTYSYDKTAVASAQSEVDSAQTTLNDANTALSDYKDEQAYNAKVKALEEEKTLLQNQMTAIDELTSKKSDAYEEDLTNLKTNQENEKKVLEDSYSDMDKLVDERFTELKKKYGENWDAIITDVTTKTASAKTQLDNLTKASIANVPNTTTTNTDTSTSSTSSDSATNSTSSTTTKAQVKAQVELLATQLQNLKDHNALMLAEKTDYTAKESTIETDASTKSTELQNTTNSTQLGNQIAFLQTFNQVTEAMLKEFLLIIDESSGDVVNMFSDSLKEIMEQLEIMKSSFDKYIEMYNTMNPDDTISSVDISGVLKSYDTYTANSLSDYVSAKALLYDSVSSNSLNASGLIDTSGLSSISTGSLSTLTSATTNNNSSNSTTNSYSITVGTIQSDNISDFLNSVTTIATQNAKTK
jgi:TP901 family phage tail tape measure protein